jgi:hypothetical protein
MTKFFLVPFFLSTGKKWTSMDDLHLLKHVKAISLLILPALIYFSISASVYFLDRSWNKFRMTSTLSFLLPIAQTHYFTNLPSHQSPVYQSTSLLISSETDETPAQKGHAKQPKVFRRFLRTRLNRCSCIISHYSMVCATQTISCGWHSAYGSIVPIRPSSDLVIF